MSITSEAYIGFQKELLTEILKEVVLEVKKQIEEEEHRTIDFVSTEKMAQDLGVKHKRFTQFCTQRGIPTHSISRDGNANGTRFVNINHVKEAIEKSPII